MNLCIAVLLGFALLGALDEGLSGRLGVAEEFRRGLASMGPLCLSMAGIYCVAVTALSGAAEAMAALPLPFDPSLPAGMLLATDMGGWASAKVLASTPALAVFSGLLVASTLGGLISFVLPVSLGALQNHEIMGFMQGVLWGIIALPVGLVLGGVVAGVPLPSLARNLWPVALLCLALCLSLRFAPRGCIRVLALVGGAVRWLGIVLFCVVVLGVFVPRAAIVPQSLVEEVLTVIFKITAVVCGSLVASRIVLAKCGRWLEGLARRLGVNEYAVLGLLACLVSNVSMLPLYSRMDVRGKVMNAAFTVSGAFVLGGQMAFVSSVAQGRAVWAFFAAKLAGGVLAVFLASCFTKNQPAPEPVSAGQK